VKAFMDENGKRPSSMSKEKQEKVLGSWICNQLANYSPDAEQCKNIMKSESVRCVWETFVAEQRSHFLTDEEAWLSSLGKVKAFIDERGKRPNNNSKEKQVKVLASWINTQLANYSPNAEECKCIMMSESVRCVWKTFVAEQRSHFLTSEETWLSTLGKVKTFMDEKGKRPSHCSKEKHEKVLASWINTQLANYSPNAEECKWIMKSNFVRCVWEGFVAEWRSHFLTHEETWLLNLERVKAFMDEKAKRPSSKSKEKQEKVLGSWICNQLANYSPDAELCKNIMQSASVRSEWEAFVAEKQALLRCKQKKT
jgi:hypothetical protein